MKKTLPIKNQMNGVFVHVTNLTKSAKWYCDLLGIEVDLEKVQSPVFNVPISGTTSLTLDDHSFDPTYQHFISPNPIFNFFTTDIDEAYRYVLELEIPIVRQIERVGETAWFNISDLDGNVVMICNC